MRSLCFVSIILIGYLNINNLYSSAYPPINANEITIAVYPFHPLADPRQQKLSQRIFDTFLTRLKATCDCKVKRKTYPISKTDADYSIAGKLLETEEGTLLINLIIIKKDTTLFLRQDGPFSIYVDMVEQLVDKVIALLNVELPISGSMKPKNQSIHKRKWFWLTTGTAVMTMTYLLVKQNKPTDSMSQKKDLPAPPYFPNP